MDPLGEAPTKASVRAYELLGIPFLIAADVSEIDTAVRRLLGNFEVGRDPEGSVTRKLRLANDCRAGVYGLYRGCDLVCAEDDLETLLIHFVEMVNSEALDGFPGFAAHAGVVAHRNNAIAYLAPSGGGKSTMVAASLGAGFRYVSDEALCIEFDSGAIVPYPKPLQLSAESCQLLGLDCIRPTGAGTTVTHTDLGALAASGFLELAHIVRLARRDGPTELIEVPRVHGVTWLLERSFNHYKQPAKTFSLVTELATHCRVWELEYGNAREAVSLVAQHLSPKSYG